MQADRRAVWTAALVLTVGVAVSVTFYFAPENVIRRKFMKAVKAFERESLLRTVWVVDREYRDGYGHDYQAVMAMVRLFHETYDNLDVVVERPVVEAEGDRARMALVCHVVGTWRGERGALAGTANAPLTATILWRKGNEGWKIVSAKDLDVPEMRGFY